MQVIDPDNIFLARQFVRAELARLLHQEFHQVYDENREVGNYVLTPEAMGRRSLKNICLSYLLAMEPLPPDHMELAVSQYEQKANMTDVMAVLTALAHSPVVERQEFYDEFYQQWQHEPLVVDKWLSLQATSSLESTLETVNALLTHPAFTISNPNKVRALIGAFANGNQVRFHVSSGAGYSFLADQIITLDPVNPQISSRLMAPFTSWKRYDTRRQFLMQKQMDRIVAQSGLSAGVYEMVQKSLL